MKQYLCDESLWESLEVCRPDRDEAPDPALGRLVEELAANPRLVDLYQQIQEGDARLAERFLEVAVPPGLAERLKNRLAAKSAETAGMQLLDESVASISAGTFPPPQDTLPVLPRKAEKTGRQQRAVSRRWFLAAGGLITAAAASFVMIYLGVHRADAYTPETALNEAIRFFVHERAKPGMLLEEQSPPKHFTFSLAVNGKKNARWRKIRDFLGRDGVAFDLPTPDGARATLYVVQRSIDGTPSQPTFHPFTTGGCAVAAWHERQLLYVLVVQGCPRTFQQLLKVSHSPIA